MTLAHATHIGSDEQILAQYGTAGKGTKKARNPASRVDTIRRRVQGRLAAVVEREIERRWLSLARSDGAKEPC